MAKLDGKHRGYLYENIDNQKAKAHLNEALFLANSETENNGIRRELMKLK
jgi:hypothetical protein